MKRNDVTCPMIVYTIVERCAARTPAEARAHRDLSRWADQLERQGLHRSPIGLWTWDMHEITDDLSLIRGDLRRLGANTAAGTAHVRERLNEKYSAASNAWRELTGSGATASAPADAKV